MLGRVIGSVSLLKYSNCLSDEDNEALSIASMSGEIMLTLINNALDGAKIDANKLELDYHKSDIHEVLNKSVNLYIWKAREKDIDLTLKISKNMPQKVEIDDGRLTQAMVNLVGNAVKFTKHGRVKVRASFIDDKKSNDLKMSFLYLLN